MQRRDFLKATLATSAVLHSTATTPSPAADGAATAPTRRT